MTTTLDIISRLESENAALRVDCEILRARLAQAEATFRAIYDDASALEAVLSRLREEPPATPPADPAETAACCRCRP